MISRGEEQVMTTEERNEKFKNFKYIPEQPAVDIIINVSADSPDLPDVGEFICFMRQRIEEAHQEWNRQAPTHYMLCREKFNISQHRMPLRLTKEEHKRLHSDEGRS